MVTRAPRGFTYLTALFMIAILAGGLALAGEMWHTNTIREKEAELLFVGHQYRKAIGRYYLAGGARYPRSLEELLKDPRQPGTVRHLRKLYPDPITGKDFAPIKAPDGGVWGVYSVSEDAPHKTSGFKLRDAGFEGAKRYADWKFIHTPAAQPAAPKPPAKPAAKQ